MAWQFPNYPTLVNGALVFNLVLDYHVKLQVNSIYQPYLIC